MIIRRSLKQHIDLASGRQLSLIETSTGHAIVDAYTDPAAPAFTRTHTDSYETATAAIKAYEAAKAAML